MQKEGGEGVDGRESVYYIEIKQIKSNFRQASLKSQLKFHSPEIMVKPW